MSKSILGKCKTRFARATIWHILVFTWLTFTIIPLLWGMSSSFRPLQDVFRHVMPFSWKAFIPAPFTLESYVTIFKKGFFTPVLNTLFVCGVTIVLGIIMASMAGFAFAQLDFPGKNLVFILVLFSFLIPFDVIAIPLYGFFYKINQLNSFQALILPGLANGLAVFLFKQFFEEIPKEVTEAARVDGASWWQIYFKIFLPLGKGAIITAGVLFFIFQWEAFLWPLIAASSPEHRLIQVAIAYLSLEHHALWNEQFAAAAIAMIIPLLLLLKLQSYFIKGISGTGLKV